VVQDANTMLTPFLPHAAQKVHELLGGSGVWAAQPQQQDVEDLDVPGQINPILTGDYASEQASWKSTPIEVGRPLEKPTPLFAKLDPKLGETGPEWAPIVTS
jgi:methionyl-tRNA synthetase